MCLKYFVRHTTCEHHEYLGSCHCSSTPCHLDRHQFYYIYDTFPLPLSPESSASDIISDTGALVCNTCAIQQSVQLDPDEVPVRYYAPTNNVYVEEVKPTEDAPPTRLVEIGPLEVEDDDRDYDYDYKSLSAADDEEWAANDEQIHDYLNTSMGYGAQEQRAYEQEQVARQLSSLPNHLAQQRQQWSFVLPGLPRDVFAMGSYAYYPMPHIRYLAAPWVQPIPNRRGDVTSPSTVYGVALPSCPTGPPSTPISPPTTGGPAKPTTPKSPTILAKCPTGPRGPPTPPFIVGCVTDAYLRIEAAKKRHMRRRARRTRSWQRDTLPAEKEILLARRDTLPDRIVSLADCMVTKRKKRVGQQGQYASDDTGEEPDTEGGAEEYTGIVETEEAIEVSACSLVAPM